MRLGSLYSQLSGVGTRFDVVEKLLHRSPPPVLVYPELGREDRVVRCVGGDVAVRHDISLAVWPSRTAVTVLRFRVVGEDHEATAVIVLPIFLPHPVRKGLADADLAPVVVVAGIGHGHVIVLLWIASDAKELAQSEVLFVHVLQAPVRDVDQGFVGPLRLRVVDWGAARVLVVHFAHGQLVRRLLRRPLEREARGVRLRVCGKTRRARPAPGDGGSLLLYTCVVGVQPANVVDGVSLMHLPLPALVRLHVDFIVPIGILQRETE